MGSKAHIIKNIIAAFSIYSKIPTPQIEWTDENTKHVIAFLPWVGAVIGAILFAVFYITESLTLPLLAKVCIFSVIPLVVTGGFHMDGYMDVQDALCSYKSREEKLLILKDPHIGSFAVTKLVIFGLLWTAAMAIIFDCGNKKMVMLCFLIFIVSRSIAVILSLKLKHARDNGMLNMETKNSNSKDFIYAVIQLVAVLVLAFVIEPVSAAAMMLTTLIYSIWYKNMCYSQFGGVSGDTTGFFIADVEKWQIMAVTAISLVLRA